MVAPVFESYIVSSYAAKFTFQHKMIRSTLHTIGYVDAVHFSTSILYRIWKSHQQEHTVSITMLQWHATMFIWHTVHVIASSTSFNMDVVLVMKEKSCQIVSFPEHEIDTKLNSNFLIPHQPNNFPHRGAMLKNDFVCVLASRSKNNEVKQVTVHQTKIR